jgi:hypothetical protein
MSLYSEMIGYMEYIHSIRKLQNYLSIDMKFPTKWSIPKNIVDGISVVAFESDDVNQKGISFVCEINEKSVNEIVFRISKIIKLNQEKEVKEMMFKKVVEELKTTFEKTELDKLKKLYFDFEDDQPTLMDGEDGYRTEPENVELVGEGED